MFWLLICLLVLEINGDTFLNYEKGTQRGFPVGTELRFCFDYAPSQNLLIKFVDYVLIDNVKMENLGDFFSGVTAEPNYPNRHPVCMLLGRMGITELSYGFFAHGNRESQMLHWRLSKSDLFEFENSDIRNLIKTSFEQHSIQVRYREINATIPGWEQPEYTFTRVLEKDAFEMISILHQLQSDVPAPRYFLLPTDVTKSDWQMEICVWRFFPKQRIEINILNYPMGNRNVPGVARGIEYGLHVKADRMNDEVVINQQSIGAEEWPNDALRFEIPGIADQKRKVICFKVNSKEDAWDIVFVQPKSDRKLLKKKFVDTYQFVQIKIDSNAFSAMRVAPLDVTKHGWYYYQDPPNIQPEFRDLLIAKRAYSENPNEWPEGPVIRAGH